MSKSKKSTVTETEVAIDQVRQEALEALYLSSYADIKSAALEDGAVRFDEAEALCGAVAILLGQYGGSPDDPDEFSSWAISEIVEPVSIRLKAFHAMREKYRRIVYAGVWAVLKGCEDLGVQLGGVERGKGLGCVGTVGELENDVWVKVWLDLDAWLHPGMAKVAGRKSPKLGTRLYAFARCQAMGWRTDRLREKKRFVRGDLAKVEEQIVGRALDRANGKPHRANAEESFAFA